MWLLNTCTGALEWFHHASEAKYAILSHVWLQKESTFQDLQRFHHEARAHNSVPVLEREELSAKIKECCRVARELGYLWVWIDTCCIDKTSSAELSEAIASMFRWYRQADVCIVFLHDVEELYPQDATDSEAHPQDTAEAYDAEEFDADDLRSQDADETYLQNTDGLYPREMHKLNSQDADEVDSQDTDDQDTDELYPDEDDPDLQDTDELDSRHADLALTRCKWFTRGWTLQELIAPAEVVFYGADWSYLGTKAGLAGAISRVSGVDVDVLTHSRPLSAISVAQRMSWASRRETTREEDRSYSLLGLFGVYIPIVYGEGSNAFYRLQEAILRDIPDQSIFAWGDVWSYDPVTLAHLPYRTPRHFDPITQCLFAPSPTSFRDAGDVKVVPLDELRCYLAALHLNAHVSIPEYTFTSHGLRARLPVFPIPANTFPGDQTIEDSTAQVQLSSFIAIIACRKGRSGGLLHLYLSAVSEHVSNQLKVGLPFNNRLADYRGEWMRADALSHPRFNRGDHESTLSPTRAVEEAVYILSRPSELLPHSHSTWHARVDHTALKAPQNPNLGTVVGFALVSVSTPFQYLQPGARPPTFVTLCRGSERIWIDFGTCLDCDPNPVPTSVPMKVSVSHSNAHDDAPRISSSHHLHDCDGGLRPPHPCQLDRKLALPCGPYTLKLAFTIHPSPISIYEECMYYDLDIELSPALQSLPPLRAVPDRCSSPLPELYTPRPVTYAQTNFPLWEGSPLPGMHHRLGPPTRGRDPDLERTVPPLSFREVDLAFAPDGTGRLAWNSSSAGIVIWSLGLDAQLCVLATQDDDVRCFSWSADGRLLAAYCRSADGRAPALRIWNADPNSTAVYQQAFRTSLRETPSLQSLTFWDDRSCLARCRESTFLWDYHLGTVSSVTGRLGRSPSSSNACQSPPQFDILDVDREKCLVIGTQLVVDPDGHCSTNSTLVCRVGSGMEPEVLFDASLRRLGSAVYGAKFVPRTDWVLCTTAAAPFIRVFDYSTRELVWADDEACGIIQHVCASHDGELVAAPQHAAGREPDGETVVHVWRSRDGSVLKTLRVRAEIYALRFSPGGEHTLAAGMGDGTVRVWTLEDWATEPGLGNAPSPASEGA
ncbi:hypothetical protein BN946_scf184499.g9 [Trametes cinnabarina]|uniref:Uncharacterized protein n=1 Tax=Pycnoporus cinnabarinus TaxID=5643 RepID=A0A060S883_PYCCI|nr:hypothetical protein BN946_scf184499.g9 [Trametes cinnabarina]